MRHGQGGRQAVREDRKSERQAGETIPYGSQLVKTGSHRKGNKFFVIEVPVPYHYKRKNILVQTKHRWLLCTVRYLTVASSRARFNSSY